MAVTKTYLFIIRFDSGSDGLDEENESLNQAINRAQSIPGHLIDVSSFENESDQKDLGYARKRADLLSNVFVENAVDIDRIQFEFPQGDGHVGGSGVFSSRAEIALYPKVASLDGDGSVLTHKQICALKTVRELALFPSDQYTDLKQQRLAGFSSDDWKRIVGYVSQDDWKRNGAKHPLWGLHAPSSLKNAVNRRWWKFW